MHCGHYMHIIEHCECLAYSFGMDPLFVIVDMDKVEKLVGKIHDLSWAISVVQAEFLESIGKVSPVLWALDEN